MVVRVLCRRAKAMKHHVRVLGSFAGITIVLVALYFSFGIPLACGSNGCIRKHDFTQQRTYDIAFARSINAQPPSEVSTLTTMIRRYLLTHAMRSSSISSADAARYRSDVLHIAYIADITNLGYSSAEEYDRLVVIPFLTQEALIKERHTDNPSALYKQLAQEQYIVLFKSRYTWDRKIGEVVAR